MPVQDEFPYDPPGSTDTRDRPIEPVTRSDSWLDGDAVSIDTDFPGARISAVETDGDSLFQITVRPENSPINNSPWFAFRIRSRDRREVTLKLDYGEARHRYVPKLSRDGRTWAPAQNNAYRPDSANGSATLRLEVGPEPLWVSAQELLTSRELGDWVTDLARLPFVTVRSYGRSREGKPLSALTISGAPDSGRWVIVLGRQHPPEVSGALAQKAFVERLVDSSDLSREFRSGFSVLCLPLVNPDGVDAGHWRHNAGGVDLNRDWEPFNQPETRAVRDLLLGLKRSGARVYFAIDFHSTQTDIFYTLSSDLPTRPAGFTQRWLNRIDETLDDYSPYEESYGLGAPISKNWLYETFGAPAVTYEAGDEVDRDLLDRVATTSATAMMELLLAELAGEDGD